MTDRVTRQTMSPAGVVVVEDRKLAELRELQRAQEERDLARALLEQAQRDAKRSRTGLLQRRFRATKPAKVRPKGTAKRRKAEKARRRSRARNR